ncbi:J protein JJJ2 [Gastrolobium bilobum]|uniref:J protein JJJ2 n=1 Tax=Gastrolobium bilobum TaxID=150636 RepID=UPI002AB18208|nr:J protein JJJ2 [Gastrolobium bilobum]
MQNAQRTEAERLLGVAEKLLQNRDLIGSREFAILAQETEPLLEGSDQILAIVDVLIAAEKRVNNHPDWYSILQVDRRSEDIDFIKKQYRRLALLLHPDKSRFYLADHAFKLVADAWNVLSDPLKKSHYDKELFSFFTRVDLSVPSWVQQDKLPVRRTGPGLGSGPNLGFDPRNRGSAGVRDEISSDENSRRRTATFWTACPYCYRLYEYPTFYESCCLKCQNCDRSFHGVAVPSLPPLVQGQEAYYCCWGFFPMGFVIGSLGSAEKEAAPPPPQPAQQPPAPQQAPQPQPQPASTLPNWMPVPAPAPADNGRNNAEPTVVVPRVTRRAAAAANRNGVASGAVTRTRGRPRKYPRP